MVRDKNYRNSFMRIKKDQEMLSKGLRRHLIFKINNMTKIQKLKNDIKNC